MAETIRSANFDDTNLKERTQITQDAEAGTQTISVLNNSGYATGDKIWLHDQQGESAEVCTIQSVAGKTITLSAPLNNKHFASEELVLLEGDQVRLYRANNVDNNIPSDSSFSYLGVYATLQGDDKTSDLTDPIGGSAYWYKTTYFNSSTAVETSLALSVAVRGGNYGRLVSIDSIRHEAGMSDNQALDDTVFAERRDQAENEILGKLAAAGYSVPFQTVSGNTYVPAVIENIARLLAAGYVLSQQFQPSTTEDVNPGKGKIKQAQQLLDDIQNNKLVLLDPTGTILGRTAQVSGWPDNTTSQIFGEDYQITMSKIF